MNNSVVTFRMIAAFALITVFATAPAGADVWFVRTDSPFTDGDATSWATAARSVADAVDAAETAGDRDPELWIAQGIYPVNAGIHVDLVGRPFDSLTLRGGFAGTENLAEDRSAPPASPPNSVNVGSSFVANEFAITRFIQSEVPVVMERISVSNMRNGSRGGLITLLGGRAELDHVYCLNNLVADFGGDVSASLGAEVVITHSRFEASKAGISSGGNGGSVNMSGDGSIIIQDSIFDGCEAFDLNRGAGRGSAISALQDTEIMIERTVFKNCTANLGGVIACSQGAQPKTLNQCEFVGNSGVFGGVLEVLGGSSETLAPIAVNDCEFLGNSAARSLFQLNQALISMTDCRVIGNTTASTFASVFSIFDSTFTAENSEFLSNRNSAAANGSVFYFLKQMSVSTNEYHLTGCTFANNSTGGSGGAIRTEEVSLAIEGSTFEGNRAGGSGGAISAMATIIMGGDEPPSLTIVDSIFRSNFAVGMGGAVSSDNPLDIRRTIFLSNSSDSGGAIHQGAHGDFQIENALFAYNSAANGGAIGIGTQETASSIRFCTFYRNVATGAGASAISIFSGLSGLTLSDTIFSEVIVPAFETGPQIAVTASDNLVSAGILIGDGSGQTEGEAVFLDPSRGDFRLADAANVEGLAGGTIADDIRGITRPVGSGRDIGAFEFTPDEDRDGDRIPDILEGPGDSDNDGVPDYIDFDTDAFEFGDVNADGQVNAVDIQSVINAVLET